MITDRKAFYAFTLIGATALLALSMATVWAQSEEADPSGQALELENNEQVGGPFSVGFTGGGSEAGATTLGNNNPATGYGNEQATPFGASGSGVSATTIDNNEPATGAFSDQDSGLSATALRNNKPATGAFSDGDSEVSATSLENNSQTTGAVFGNGGNAFFGRNGRSGGQIATGVSATGAAAGAAAVVFPAGGIAVFATNSVELRKNTEVTGDIVVNDKAVFIDDDGNEVPLPTLDIDEGFELNFRGGNSLVTGDITADSIDVSNNSTVTGTASFNELTKHKPNTVDIQGAEISPLDLPVLVPPAFQPAGVSPAAPNIVVGIGQTITLPLDLPSSEYGDITLKKNSILVFQGGIFNVRSIVDDGAGGNCGDKNPGAPGDGSGLDPCRAVVFDAASDVRIDGFFDVGKNAYVGPADGSGIDASDLIVYVATANGGAGVPISAEAAVLFGNNNTIKANFYAANGTIKFQKQTIAEGAFLARDVLLGTDVVLTLNAFDFGANQAPVADPQTVETDDVQPLVITLTASDPDGDDLTFSIVTPPNGAVGSLGLVMQDDPPSPGVPPGCSPNVPPGCTTDPDPPRTSATVTYTPITAAENSFVFAATDPSLAAGTATVEINEPPEVEDPPDPVATVEAFNVDRVTTVDLATTVTLRGEAPCLFTGGAGEDPVYPCDSLPTPADDTPLTFGVLGDGCAIGTCTGPANGTLSTLIQLDMEDVIPPTLPNGDGILDPQRVATVLYTPDALFEGMDTFTFQACGDIDGVPTCDTATATIDVFAVPDVVAVDQLVVTPEDTPVRINLGGPGAGAEIAGSVVDEGADGTGNAHDPLPGTAPELMSASAEVDEIRRIHIEWNITDLHGLVLGAGDTAEVTLHTLRGASDSVDTELFLPGGEGGGDGLLTNSDFRFFDAPFTGVPPPPTIATMPVVGTVGTPGTFVFDVLPELKAALEPPPICGFIGPQACPPDEFFSIQGRTKFVEDGGNGICEIFETCIPEAGSGLQVRTTATGNLAAFLEPQLDVTIGGVALQPLITFSITVLPDDGELTNSLGQAVLAPAVLPGSDVTYTPNVGFVELDSFQFEADDGSTTDLGLVEIDVNGADLPEGCGTIAVPIPCIAGR